MRGGSRDITSKASLNLALFWESLDVCGEFLPEKGECRKVKG